MGTMSLAQALATTEGFYANHNPPTAAQRDNNPQDIVNGPFAQKYGATGPGDSATAINGQPANAIFPSQAAGFAAQNALLSGPAYAGLTLTQMYAKLAVPDKLPGTNTPDPVSVAAHAKNLAYISRVTGIGVDQVVPSQVGATLSVTPGSATPETTQFGADAADAVAAVPVSGTALTSDQYASIYNLLNPQLVITTNLDQQPWYEDKSIVQQNHPSWNPEPIWDDQGQKYVHRYPVNPFPVCFQVYFQPNYQSRLGPTPSQPTVINLKASINSHEKAMQHIISKQKTRTGLLIDLWGMQPDSITGQGSTGLMQNQLGITDYISLMKPNDQALAAVRQGFNIISQTNTPLNPLTTIPTAASQADAASAAAAALRQGFATSAAVAVNDSADTQVALSEDSFRVAARDAFAEFLWLFKNNGSVWFRSPASTGVTTSQSQLPATTWSSQSQYGPDAWSQKTGESSFQTINSRNDVMTRGHVVMFFRNAAYAGYFKSLTWSLDAASPFRWNFNFIFAVESTVLNIGVP